MSLAPRAARGSTPGRLSSASELGARSSRPGWTGSGSPGSRAGRPTPSCSPPSLRPTSGCSDPSGQPWSFPCSFPGRFCSLVGGFVGLCFCLHDNHFMTSLRCLSFYSFFSLLSGVFPFMLFVTFKPRNGFVTLDLGVPFVGAALPGN